MEWWPNPPPTRLVGTSEAVGRDARALCAYRAHLIHRLRADRPRVTPWSSTSDSAAAWPPNPPGRRCGGLAIPLWAYGPGAAGGAEYQLAWRRVLAVISLQARRCAELREPIEFVGHPLPQASASARPRPRAGSPGTRHLSPDLSSCVSSPGKSREGDHASCSDAGRYATHRGATRQAPPRFASGGPSVDRQQLVEACWPLPSTTSPVGHQVRFSKARTQRRADGIAPTPSSSPLGTCTRSGAAQPHVERAIACQLPS